MTFDQTIFLCCIAAPAVITAGSCLLSTKLWQGNSGLVVSLGWWIAVTTSLALRQGWQWWPEDAWRQAIWPLLAWILLVCGTAAAEESKSWRWIIAGVLASLTAMIAMPGGEGWEDTFNLHRTWIPLVSISCLVNAFALEQVSRSRGHRWILLVALAGLAGPMALAASSYGSLAEWTLAMIVATAVVAVFGIFKGWNAGLWTAAIPASIGAAGITAAARFYSYEEYPAWVMAISLFAPAIVALTDFTIQTRNIWVRVAVSGTLSAGLAAACIWRVLLG